ncbi:MAG TPA: hypothetical protein VF727_12990 [Allosphingosinicella sp.]|jgi:hypothetical protein
MTDHTNPPEGHPEQGSGPCPWEEEPDPPGQEGAGPLPWDCDPADEEDDPATPRLRHDAFTEARKAEFLTALVKTGCIVEAAQRIGVSPRTIYRHQESDPRFFDHCDTALRMSATPLELTAWQRAVEGVEQEFACGGQVHVRRRYDGSLLRLLLQGSNPKKYGARPGFKRRRQEKRERKRAERLRGRARAVEEMPIEDVRAEVLRRIKAIRGHRERNRLAQGWTQTPDGDWIPPGYGPIPGWQGPGEGSEGAGTPRDSM